MEGQKRARLHEFVVCLVSFLRLADWLVCFTLQVQLEGFHADVEKSASCPGGLVEQTDFTDACHPVLLELNTPALFCSHLSVKNDGYEFTRQINPFPLSKKLLHKSASKFSMTNNKS